MASEARTTATMIRVSHAVFCTPSKLTAVSPTTAPIASGRARPGAGVGAEGERHRRATGGLADDEAPARQEAPQMSEPAPAVDVGAARLGVERGELGRGGRVAVGDDRGDPQPDEQPAARSCAAGPMAANTPAPIIEPRPMTTASKGPSRRERRLAGSVTALMLDGFGVHAQPAGWKSSTTLPDGSSSRICLPPGPWTMSLRKASPARRRRSTSATRSTTMRWMRFQPPGPG